MVASLKSETVSLKEVAAALGVDEGWVKRNWRRLNETHGFPRPLPSTRGTGWMWPRRLTLAWLVSGGVPTSTDASAETIEAARQRFVDEARQALKDKYAGRQ